MVLLGLGVAIGGCASGGRALGPVGGGSSKRGAPWTIRCLELQGEAAPGTIAQLAEALRRTPGIRPNEVFTRDDADGFSRLYYGTYYRPLERNTGRRRASEAMQRDLELIRELGVADGRRLFVAALPVRLPMPDVGDPAWDLRNVDAVYSLQVAVFEPTEEFFEYKQAAADYCSYLRERGYEAYYYHAPASSSVTVGAFGADAVVSRAVFRDGQTHYVPEYSQEVQRLQQAELLQYNLLNGAVYRVRNETGLSEPVRSRLVEVPRRDRR